MTQPTTQPVLASRRRLARSALMGRVTPAVRRLLAACLIAGCVVLVGAPAGGATPSGPAECPKIGPTKATEAANAIFTGVVASVERTSRGPGDAEFTHAVEVELVYKGRIAEPTVPVLTRGDTRARPGLGPLEEGERYLFFASSGAEAYAADGCSGTAPVADEVVARVEELLGEGRPAVPPPAPEASFEKVADSEPASFTRAAAPGLALVLVGVLGLIVVRRLARRTA